MKAISTIVLTLLMTSCALQQAGPYSDLSDDELVSLFIQAKAETPLRYCERLVPITGSLSRRDASNQKRQADSDYAQFQCAIDEGRWNDAYTAMVRFEKSSERSMGSVGFDIAYFSDHYEDAVERLEAIGPDNYSSEIFKIDPERFWRLLSELSSKGEKGLQERAVRAMVESPYFDILDLYFRSNLADWQFEFDAQSGSFNDTEKLISAMVSPIPYISMLSDKRFETIWPDLERAVGEHFVDINDRNLKSVTKKYQRDTSDMESYQQMAHALVFAGEFQRVIDFVKTPAEEDFGAITENEAWALNMKIEALDALGRQKEATDIFESLATIPVDDSNKNWLINFTINRADRLAGYGKWQQALEATEYAENFIGSAYAKMIIRRLKVCSGVHLGVEADSLLDEVYENRQDSYVNAALAMMCDGDRSKAEKIVIEALKDPSERQSILAALQGPKASFYVVRPENPALHGLLNTNEELSTIFEKEARFIPDKYTPWARIKSFYR